MARQLIAQPYVVAHDSTQIKKYGSSAGGTSTNRPWAIYKGFEGGAIERHSSKSTAVSRAEHLMGNQKAPAVLVYNHSSVDIDHVTFNDSVWEDEELWLKAAGMEHY